MSSFLYIDIETYSPVNLVTQGVYKYAENPDFEMLLFGYAFNGGPVQVIDFTVLRSLPDDLISALHNPEITKIAYNANFERVCLNKALKKSLPVEQWQCLAVMAAELGLPKTLAQACEVVGVSEDKQKLKTGQSLINYFCVPHKNKNPQNLMLFDYSERRTSGDAPDRWQQFIEYNMMDVEAERALYYKLKRFFIHETEKTLWFIDQKINDRGVAADLVLAQKAVIMSDAAKAELSEKAKTLTGLDNPSSNEQAKSWIRQEIGGDITTLRKEKLNEVKKTISNEAVKEFLDIRSGLSKTSVKKYDAILRSACEDRRLRGLTQFYGANRTGRWAGRLVQLQNLPAENLAQLQTARELVRTGNMRLLEMLYGDVPTVLSNLIRSCLEPANEHKLVCADFNAIEARVLAWLADEQWRLEVFRNNGKIYETSAERMFNLQAGSVKKGDPMRQKGKIAELALGYGGGTGALIAMGALNKGLTEDELMPLVYKWRRSNRNITNLWELVSKAAWDVVKRKNDLSLISLAFTKITFYREGPLLRVKLPNGRSLSYVKPAIKNHRLVYFGNLQDSGGWGEVRTYGAKLVENIVQAIARDCLASALIEIENAGWPVVFHVHDEVVCEAPKNDAGKALADMLRIMAKPLSWAPGLPLGAEGFICDYYRKG
jgi:DNA polymerase